MWKEVFKNKTEKRKLSASLRDFPNIKYKKNFDPILLISENAGVIKESCQKNIKNGSKKTTSEVVVLRREENLSNVTLGFRVDGWVRYPIIRDDKVSWHWLKCEKNRLNTQNGNGIYEISRLSDLEEHEVNLYKAISILRADIDTLKREPENYLKSDKNIDLRIWVYTLRSSTLNLARNDPNDRLTSMLLYEHSRFEIFLSRAVACGKIKLSDKMFVDSLVHPMELTRYRARLGWMVEKTEEQVTEFLREYKKGIYDPKKVQGLKKAYEILDSLYKHSYRMKESANEYFSDEVINLYSKDDFSGVSLLNWLYRLDNKMRGVSIIEKVEAKATDSE